MGRGDCVLEKLSIRSIRNTIFSVLELCFVLAVLQRTQEFFLPKEEKSVPLTDVTTEKQIHPEDTGFLDMTAYVGGNSTALLEENVWKRLFGEEVPELALLQREKCIAIPKNGAVLVRVEQNPVYRSIRMSFSNTTAFGLQVYRISGQSLYSGAAASQRPKRLSDDLNVPLVYEPSGLQEDPLLSCAISEEEGLCILSMETDTVYEAEVTEDADFVYVSLVRPYEKYDKIVVLDAGHGGIDIGTSGGGVTESSINLQVIRYAKEILDEMPEYKIYYTRLDDSLPDLSTRVEFANALHADFLISVHCNYNSSSSVNGVEVMYSSKQVVDEQFSSRTLASKCLHAFTEAEGMKMRECVDRCTNLHLMKYDTMPSVIVEIGFMSNKSDLAKLKKESTKKTCAETLCRVIEEVYDEWNESFLPPAMPEK